MEIYSVVVVIEMRKAKAKLFVLYSHIYYMQLRASEQQ